MPESVVEFPLRGEWSATSTPGHRIPSHGTHLFGQTYAYDFARLGKSESDFCSFPIWVYFSIGVPTRSSYSFGEPIYSATDGEVIAASGELRDRLWLHPLTFLMSKRSLVKRLKARRNVGIAELVGNHITVQFGDGLFALYAHLKYRSVAVAVGDRVRPGQQLAEVGQTGNAVGPHLHFQVMDSPDIYRAKGVPCKFLAYQSRSEGGWESVSEGIPRLLEVVRGGA
jgi:murein DD-endopeptidase MepM/ murein hydrolase activator NlpD